MVRSEAMNIFKKSILLLLSAFSISLVGCNKNKDQEKPFISINPTSIEMYEEDYGLVKVDTNVNKPISFTSGNSDIVSVNSSGVLLAKNAGTTIVKAIIEDLYATCSVTVKPLSEKVEDYIRFEKSLFIAGLNESPSERAIVPTYYHGGEAISDKTFTYSSSNDSIASVNSSGNITINGVGTTSIVVRCDSISASVVVDVYDIVIRTTNDWENMLKTTKNRKARFYLDNDLDFEGVEYQSYSAYENNLMGELKGNYHTVSNITMKPSDSIQSIFGFASVFSLSDIRFVNVIFTSIVKNAGLFTSLYQHYSEGGVSNLVGQSVISNVLCDFSFSDVTSTVIADKFYGANVDYLFARVRSAAGKTLKESNTYLMAYSYYTWFGTSHFINLIGLVEDGNITKNVKNANPADTLYYPDTINEVKTDSASSLIEANYLASLSFDTNIWEIKPNELPSFL